MLSADCSKLDNEDSALAGVFAKSTRSFASSASVIVSMGYILFLAFFVLI